jgi:alpha-L-fucosidase
MAAWMAVNGEAIFGTRPWRVYGEGPTQIVAGVMNEGAAKAFEAADIRYTSRRDVLYALPLDWPVGEIRLRSLAAGQAGEVRRVELLGGPDPLPFRRDADALVVRLPERRPAFTPVLKIEGPGLA